MADQAEYRYRIEIQAVGDHGCQREVDEGAAVTECHNPKCPDCIFRRAIASVLKAGHTIEIAKMIHRPDDTGLQVTDDFKTGTRGPGDFKKKNTPTTPAEQEVTVKK